GRVVTFQAFQALRHILRPVYRHAFKTQPLSNCSTQHTVVFNQQHIETLPFHAFSPVRGKTNSMVEPVPGVSWTEISPLSSIVKRRTISSPSDLSLRAASSD